MTWQGPEAARDCSEGSPQGPGWGSGLGPWKQWRQPLGGPEQGPRLRPRRLRQLQGPQTQGGPSRQPALWLGGPGRPVLGRAGGPQAGGPAAGAGEPQGLGWPSGPVPPAAVFPGAARTQSWAWAGGRKRLAGLPGGQKHHGSRARPCAPGGGCSPLQLLGSARLGRGRLQAGQSTSPDELWATGQHRPCSVTVGGGLEVACWGCGSRSSALGQAGFTSLAAGA